MKQQVSIDTKEITKTKSKYPNVLILDMTRIGSDSATGQLKKTLFSGWPSDQLMQVFSKGDGIYGIFRENYNGNEGIREVESVILECEKFDPDVIYYRPTNTNLHLHNLALKLINHLGVPFITHIMDDWPERLKYNNKLLYAKIDSSLRKIFKDSYTCLSICDSMSIGFKERYNTDFIPISNCIKAENWLSLDQSLKKRNKADEPFVIRYSGALADDMNFNSILDVARVVDSLAGEIDIRLEIHTMPVWKKKALKHISKYKNVSIRDDFLPQEQYKKFLMDCDALLIAYNFDEESIRYVRYSMANKLPEYMASSVPMLAYGPLVVSTIAYIAEGEFAELVTEQKDLSLRNAILKLVHNPGYGKELADKARETVFKQHNSDIVIDKFQTILRQCAASNGWTEDVKPISSINIGILGSYPRDAHANFDENKLVANLLPVKPCETVIMDIGAHHGSSLAPFLEQGCKVYAFEPDPVNREKLKKRFDGYSALTIDQRAVSDQVFESVPFYSSDVSTGISTLAPFHESHTQACCVSTTTVAEFAKEQGLFHINFLKIDTEGFDLMVLKGVPWDKIQPDVILCEFEDNKTKILGYTTHDLAQFLTNLGYKVFVSEWHPIIRYGIQHDWYRLVTYPCRLKDAGSWGNLLAFRYEPDLKLIYDTAKSIIKTDEKTKINNDVTKKDVDVKASKNSMNNCMSKDDVAAKAKVAAHNQANKPVINTVTVSNNSSQKRVENKTMKKNYYKVFSHYLIDNHPTLARIGRFGMYCLRTLKKRLLGIGGLSILVIIALYAGAFANNQYRWLLAGGGTGLLLLLLGGLTISYFQFAFLRYANNQHRETSIIANRISNIDKKILNLNSAINDLKMSLDNIKENKLNKEKLNEVSTAAENIKNIYNDFEKLKEGIEQVNSSIDDIYSRTSHLEHNIELVSVMQKIEMSGVQEVSKNIPDKIKREIAPFDNFVRKNNSFNNSLFQRFNRQLRFEDIELIKKVWLPQLGLMLDSEALGYFAHRICLAEDTCIGRLATSVEDELLRVLTARSVKDKDLEVLEIGTLFGVGVAGILETCRGIFDNLHVTVIDPFDGYYAKKVLDILTKMPVTQDIFLNNMQRMNIPENQYTIIKKYSTQDEAIVQAAEKQYNLLIIDGDHSYSGVKFDFYNYRSMVKPGGYIIFDDYDSSDWPDIKTFVDKEVSELPELQFVGADWRTAVFRVITPFDRINQ